MVNKKDFIVVCDTREQHEWTFSPDIQVVSKALPAGDYSIQGHEKSISLERKTLSDLVNCLIHDRDRFFRELVKLKSYRRKAVVIEASVADVFEMRYKSEAHPYSILGAVQSFHMTFDIPFLWWHSREYAQWMGAKWLEQAAKRAVKWQERESLEATEGHSE
jgi:DNA excision repair protein ERCC-4